MKSCRFAVWFAVALLTLSGAVYAADPPGKAEWQTPVVPDVWKGGSDGYAWYRCLVVVPEAWRGQDLELFLEPVDDAREAYLNGNRIATAGDFPPEFRSGLGADERFKIAAKDVRFGAANLLAIRVYREQGRAGFNVAAPVLFAKDEAMRLAGKWQSRTGDNRAWATWDEETEAALFADVRFTKVEPAEDVRRTLKKLQGDDGPLSIAESLKRFKTPDDLTVELAVGEPAIGQPLSFKFDERGRLWVFQYLQYPNPAGLKMLSRDKFLRSVYDKVPPPPPNHFRGLDKITIHEDTDGDGVYEKHKTFVDGLSLVTSFARGRGGVWVLNPPYLLFYPDRDGDDRPDGDPEVHLEGFGIEDSHSITNSLRWGPDGWLYASQGSTVTGDVRRPGEKAVVHSLGQLIWRYHPETRRYEIFAEGGGNSFGVEIDAKGRIYSGHNGGNTRGFHYVQGGYYQKGFEKHGQLSNPYAFGYFPMMSHPNVPRFTHTFIIYDGGALSGQYQGKLFGVAPLLSHVVISDVQPDGSSFKTRDVGHALTTNDTWFRPVDIQTGPDGAIYVADWYEQRIDHASHYQGRIHKESGRIYRLRAKDSPRTTPFNYRSYSTPELIGSLGHTNKWHRQEALRMLGDRRDPAAVPLLEKSLRESTGQVALESLWALNLSGGLTNANALEWLKHDDPYVRLWTVRLLCDRPAVDARLVRELVELAAREPHVEARSQLACSARRLPAADCLAIVERLLRRKEDVNDIHVPLLLWWAIEAKCESDRDAVVSLFSDRPLWDEPIVEKQIAERLMRRFAMAGTRKDLMACAKLLEFTAGTPHAKKLLAGFEKAFEGRSLAALPDELVTAIAKVGGGSLALRLRQGDAAAVAESLALIADEKAAKNDRVQYVQILGETKQAKSVPVLLKIVAEAKDNAVRVAALSALQSFADESIPTTVVRLYSQLPDDVRSVAQTLLASRKASAIAFLEAVESGSLKPDAIPLPVVRKLLLHDHDRIATLVRKHYGDVQGATTDAMREQIAKHVRTLGSGSGNPYNGKTLFTNNCGKCHILFGEGGRIGPDLTTYKRDDLQGMLLHVVNPSASIREGYENYVAVLDDGRTLNGFIEDQDSRVVVLKGIDGQSTVLARDHIEDLRATPRSLMPDGILNPYTDQQVRDLFAYLRATQPLPR